MKPIDPKRFSDVQRDNLYPVADIARRFGVKVDTLHRWWTRSDKAFGRHPGGVWRYCRGEDVLEFLGQLLGGPPVETETDVEAKRRCEATLRDLKRIAVA